MIGNVGGARPHYYDRRPTTVDLTTNAGPLAPHALTVRSTRTIAAGKKAQLEAVYIRATRYTAAAPAAEAAGQIRYHPVGGTLSEICAAYLFTNGVFDTRVDTLSNVGLMTAGDICDIATKDSSTGGTIGFVGKMKLTEYDA